MGYLNAKDLAEIGKGTICYHLSKPTVLYEVMRVYRKKNNDVSSLSLRTMFAHRHEKIIINFKICKEELEDMQFYRVSNNEMVQMVRKVQERNPDVETVTIYKSELEKYEKERDRLRAIVGYFYDYGCNLSNCNFSNDQDTIREQIDSFITGKIEESKEARFPTPIVRRTT